MHQPCMPYKKCLSMRRLFSQIITEQNDNEKKSLIDEFKFKKCGNFTEDNTVCCDQWHMPETCAVERLQEPDRDSLGQQPLGHCGLPNTIDFDGNYSFNPVCLLIILFVFECPW